MNNLKGNTNNNNDYNNNNFNIVINKNIFTSKPNANIDKKIIISNDQKERERENKREKNTNLNLKNLNLINNNNNNNNNNVESFPYYYNTDSNKFNFLNEDILNFSGKKCVEFQDNFPQSKNINK